MRKQARALALLALAAAGCGRGWAVVSLDAADVSLASPHALEIVTAVDGVTRTTRFTLPDANDTPTLPRTFAVELPPSGAAVALAVFARDPRDVTVATATTTLPAGAPPSQPLPMLLERPAPGDGLDGQRCIADRFCDYGGRCGDDLLCHGCTRNECVCGRAGQPCCDRRPTCENGLLCDGTICVATIGSGR